MKAIQKSCYLVDIDVDSCSLDKSENFNRASFFYLITAFEPFGESPSICRWQMKCLLNLTSNQCPEDEDQDR